MKGLQLIVKENSSLLCTIGASVGVVTTAVLAARAGYKHSAAMSTQDPHMSKKEEAKHVWRLYVPTAASGAATVICVAGARRIDGAKTLAAQAALAVSQRAYEGYRDQVVEELGERKDQTFVAKVAEKEVAENPPTKTIVAGSGKVLCCERFTGRYFESDMQTLDRAVNELNAKMLKHDYATLDDLYYMIGLELTDVSSQAGWQSDRLLELRFSSVLHDGNPVLAFEYNYVKSF